MNPYTKRSLIHFLLSFVALAIGIAVFVMISNSISESLNQPVDEKAAFAEIGKFFAIFAGAILVLIVGIIDAVFAYFSHENAKLAIEEGGDTSTTPKTLRVLSLIEMIIAAIIAIVGGLLLIIPFVF